MNISVSSFAFLAAAVSFGFFERKLRRSQIAASNFARLGTICLAIGLLDEIVRFVVAVRLGHSPFARLETSLLGFSICFVGLGLTFMIGMKSRLLGIVVAPVALVVSIAASAMPASPAIAERSLFEMSSLGLAAHAVLGYSGYTAFFLASLGGALFILQDQQLRRRNLGLLFEGLPSLEISSKIIAVGLITGLFLFAGSFSIAGASLRSEVSPSLVWSDPNVRTIAISMIYGFVAAVIGKKRGWQDLRTAYIALALGAVILLSRILFASESGLHGLQS